MSETKKHRSVAEITQEYANLCTKAGDIQYRIFVMETDLAALNKTLQDLNLEGAASQEAENAAKAAEAKAAAEATKTEEVKS